MSAKIITPFSNAAKAATFHFLFVGILATIVSSTFAQNEMGCDIGVLKNIQFRSGSATLRSGTATLRSGSATLRSGSATLRVGSDTTIGVADELMDDVIADCSEKIKSGSDCLIKIIVSSDAKVRQLSLRRAKAIIEKLTNSGIAGDRIAVAYGNPAEDSIDITGTNERIMSVIPILENR